MATERETLMERARARHRRRQKRKGRKPERSPSRLSRLLGWSGVLACVAVLAVQTVLREFRRPRRLGSPAQAP
jgi:hypothetical protein